MIKELLDFIFLLFIALMLIELTNLGIGMQSPDAYLNNPTISSSSQVENVQYSKNIKLNEEKKLMNEPSPYVQKMSQEAKYAVQKANPATETKSVETATVAEAAVEKVAAATAAEAAATEKVAAAKENLTAATEKVGAAKAAEAAPEAAKKQPGFEGILSIIVLITLAYLMLERK
jgi:hypothetical protein